MPFAYDLTGTLLDRRYRITGLLGKGGMGHVYDAVHVGLDQRVAIKVLHPRYAHEQRFRERFIREARSASRIKHRNVVRISDFGDTPDGSVYFAMEFLQGHDLGAELKKSGAMPWPRARHILLQVVGALEAAHAKSIIHRDIKPANCFLTEDKDEGIVDFVKVLDFGIAKVGSQSHKDAQGKGLTGTGEVFGTATYMSPEQACGNELDVRSDLYSLGVMAYEMLTGQVPFTGINSIHVITRHLQDDPEPLRSVEPSVPGEVEALVLRTLAKKREDRYESMGALAGALRGIPEAAGGSVGRRTLVWGESSSGARGPSRVRSGTIAAPEVVASRARAGAGGGNGGAAGSLGGRASAAGSLGGNAGVARSERTAVLSPSVVPSAGGGVNKRSMTKGAAVPRPRAPLSSESVPTARTARPFRVGASSSSPASSTTAHAQQPPRVGGPSRPEGSPGPARPTGAARPAPPRAIRSKGPPAARRYDAQGDRGTPSTAPAPSSEGSGALPPSALSANSSGPPVRVDPSTPPPGRVDPSTPPPGRHDPSTPPPGYLDPSTPPPGSVDPSTPPPGRLDPSTPPPGSVDPSTPPLSAWNVSSTGPLSAMARGDSSAETSPHMFEAVEPASGLSSRVILLMGLLVILVGGGSAVGTMMFLSTQEASAQPDDSGLASVAPLDGGDAAVQDQATVQDQAAGEDGAAVDNDAESPETTAGPAQIDTAHLPTATNASVPTGEPDTEVPAEPASTANPDDGSSAEVVLEPPVQPADSGDDVLVIDDEPIDPSDSTSTATTSTDDDPSATSNSPARPMHETASCAKTRAEAQAATQSRQWKRVITSTGKRHCWPPAEQEERLRLKVWGLLERGEFAKCIRAGRQARQAQTRSMVASCEKAQEQQ